jgi:hypothetical protein
VRAIRCACTSSAVECAPAGTAPRTIANVKLYHVLIDRGAALNLISLQEAANSDGEAPAVTPILRSGHGAGYAARLHLPLGHIWDGRELPHEERPFRRRAGQPPVQRHSGQTGSIPDYGGVPLRVPGPKDAISNGVLKIREDPDVGACALEKLQALVAAREAAEKPRSQDPAPPSSRQCGSASAPRVQPSAKEDVPVKTVQIGAEAGLTTCVSVDLDSK